MIKSRYFMIDIFIYNVIKSSENLMGNNKFLTTNTYCLPFLPIGNNGKDKTLHRSFPIKS